MHSTYSKLSGFISLFIVQIIFLVVYWVYVRYDVEALPKDDVEGTGLKEEHVSKYSHFQDIHVMIFVGFAFLMTFLKKYAYSSTGFNLFLAALVVEWSLLMKGFLNMENGVIKLSLESLIDADISAAVPLISMGALLGRITPIQLLFMSIIEVALFAVNEYIALDILSITDVGGSIIVHAFGAYFGLAVSLMLRPSKNNNDGGKFEGASYNSDTFAMIGTLFLWIFWPSFNSVLVDGHDQERAIINTYLSLAAATVTTFVLSAIVSHENKLDMVHVQNSTLAGGVAVGSVCNLLIGPHGAVLIGIVAGTISVLGYRYLSPLLKSNLRIHDTCGVHNLHGMPAVLSAIFSAIYAALAKKDDYKSSLTDIFPAMTDPHQIGTMKSLSGTNATEMILGGYGRTAGQQGGYQLFAIAMTVSVAIVGGLITGTVMRQSCIRNLTKEEQHDDEQFWEVPEEKEC